MHANDNVVSRELNVNLAFLKTRSSPAAYFILQHSHCFQLKRLHVAEGVICANETAQNLHATLQLSAAAAHFNCFHLMTHVL